MRLSARKCFTPEIQIWDFGKIVVFSKLKKKSVFSSQDAYLVLIVILLVVLKP